MLWDLIRDFFVIHVFGGATSTDALYGGLIGVGQEGNLYMGETSIKLPFYDANSGNDYLYLTIGDWLSTTATIITITIIVVLCCLFVYKIIKLIGGLIR